MRKFYIKTSHTRIIMNTFTASADDDIGLKPAKKCIDYCTHISKTFIENHFSVYSRFDHNCCILLHYVSYLTLIFSHVLLELKILYIHKRVFEMAFSILCVSMSMCLRIVETFLLILSIPHSSQL